MKNKNNRIFIKLSGDMLSGEGKKGYDHSLVERYLDEIVNAVQEGYQIVIGVGRAISLRIRQI